jgi:hypothetical protein
MRIDQNNFDNYWGYGLLMLLTAVMIVAVTGSQDLLREHTPIVYQNH